MPEPQLRCPRCYSDRYVSVSFDRGWTRKAQCVPCGSVYAKLGPGDADPNYRSSKTEGTTDA